MAVISRVKLLDYHKDFQNVYLLVLPFLAWPLLPVDMKQPLLQGPD